MGPLEGITVVEIASLGPGPFCGMVLADLGASVIRVERVSSVFGDHSSAPPKRPLERSRRSIGIDLKDPAGAALILRMVERADAMIEGFRPGVAERLGIGPGECLARNPRLVYGRVTGWGRSGPLAGDAGHDIDYLALAGALHPIGRAGERPVPPLNMVADFGGGGMLLAVGVLAALVERDRSGAGQVVDAAMIDGAALQTTMVHGMLAEGLWTDERGVNLLDGGAPFYDVYETADGRFMAVGAIEPQFFSRLVELLGLDPPQVPDHLDRNRWPELRALLTDAFATRSRDEWAAIFSGEDACAAPVLSLVEAPDHPHHVTGGTFVRSGGVVQPSPAPRFSRTQLDVPTPPPHPGTHTDEVLTGCGVGPEEIARLREAGTIR
ncbi:MAG: CoA transferase [Actinobacteria bacterium]|nr:CoA transferase [Actinomycetota bacterium]MBU1865790.1 CoA transferase [Actinomycetota bacterium]